MSWKMILLLWVVVLAWAVVLAVRGTTTDERWFLTPTEEREQGLVGEHQ